LFAANKGIPEVSAINWKLTVIEADIINAAAFPSGDLVVFTGLLDFVENDDELAIIMAHEMSHVTK
jgi:Zn-dependent protease with chaperone function